jgi:hypothetical protein
MASSINSDLYKLGDKKLLNHNAMTEKLITVFIVLEPGGGTQRAGAAIQSPATFLLTVALVTSHGGWSALNV